MNGNFSNKKGYTQYSKDLVNINNLLYLWIYERNLTYHGAVIKHSGLQIVNN